MNFLNKTGLSHLWENIQKSINQAMSFKVDKADVVGEAEALETLVELNIVEPAYQDGVIYTDADGAVFVI